MGIASIPGILLRAALITALFSITCGAYANTITVNSTADVAANDGQCTLREAIIAANTNTASGAMAGECAAGAAGLDTIAFNIAGAGVHTITPGSNLPLFTEPITIDGYTQPGATPNTAAFPGALNTVLRIELNLSTSFLSIDQAGSTIRGLVINRGVDNVLINADNVTVQGNFIGTDPAGAVGLPNAIGGFGIRTNGARSFAVIGGPNPADRNLISGNLQGGIIGSIAGGGGALIQGNFIGSDATGTVSLLLLPNTGIGLTNISNTTVLSNLISGNQDGGVAVIAPGNVVIQGNLIGTQRDGLSPLPNGNFGGVDLGPLGDNCVVGGGGAGQGNVIALNGGWGVDVRSNNNQISGNSIFGNTFLGITLTASNVPLPNDNCDADSGAGNQRANYPVITSAVVAAGNVTISGTLNSTSGTDFVLEFFSNTSCDPSGNGEGQTFLGSANVTTQVGNCNVNFGPLVFPVPPGQAIFTATATGKGGGNHTSEFSACFPTGGPPPATPTATTTPTTTATATPTSVVPTTTPTPGGGPAAVVPMLSFNLLILLGLALLVAAILLIRRSG